MTVPKTIKEIMDHADTLDAESSKTQKFFVDLSAALMRFLHTMGKMAEFQETAEFKEIKRKYQDGEYGEVLESMGCMKEEKP